MISKVYASQMTWSNYEYIFLYITHICFKLADDKFLTNLETMEGWICEQICIYIYMYLFNEGNIYQTYISKFW